MHAVQALLSDVYYPSYLVSNIHCQADHCIVSARTSCTRLHRSVKFGECALSCVGQWTCMELITTQT